MRVTPEAVEITYFSGFDRSVTQEMIERYDLRCDCYRNRRIGDYLKELGLCEGRNIGIPKALASLDANGSARPTFRTDEARGFIFVRIAIHPAFLPNREGPSQKELEYRARIKEALRGGPLSLSELSRAMGYKSIPKRLSKAVEVLAAEGDVAKVATGGLRTKNALVVR